MKLRDLAQIIRTKNAGPYIYTADIMFDDAQTYATVVASGAITRQSVSSTYGISLQEVISVISYDPARCIKVNLRRPVTSGDMFDTDVLGMQQHVPLLQMEVPYKRDALPR